VAANKESDWRPATLALTERGYVVLPEAMREDGWKRLRGEAEHLLDLADSEDGVWRCHSSFECTAACPQSVDPAGRIMSLRGQAVRRRWKRLWGM